MTAESERYPDLSVPIELTLTRGQVLSLCRLVNAAIKKKRRSRVRSDFVPEDGHRHADDVSIEAHEKLLKVLLEAAEWPLDEGRPSRRQAV